MPSPCTFAAVDARLATVDRFNHNDDVFAFLLSTRAGGQGLNLTGADTVILHGARAGEGGWCGKLAAPGAAAPLPLQLCPGVPGCSDTE